MTYLEEYWLLRRFCGDAFGSERFRKIYRIGNRAYATDGRILVRKEVENEAIGQTSDTDFLREVDNIMSEAAASGIALPTARFQSWIESDAVRMNYAAKKAAFVARMKDIANDISPEPRQCPCCGEYVYVDGDGELLSTAERDELEARASGERLSGFSAPFEIKLPGLKPAYFDMKYIDTLIDTLGPDGEWRLGESVKSISGDARPLYFKENGGAEVLIMPMNLKPGDEKVIATLDLTGTEGNDAQ